MQVAEIAVWFGGSLVELRHLATGGFRIGAGRDVDLAVVGLTSFPLVAWTERGCVLRIPAGTTAWRLVDGARSPLDGGVTLAPGHRVELAIGAVTIRVELVARGAALPRPPLELAWSRWVVGTLLAHLIALVAIDGLAEPEPAGVYVPSLASLLPQLPEPPPPPPPPDTPRARLVRRPAKRATPAPTPRIAAAEPAVDAIEVAPEPAKRRARAVEGARRAGVLGGGMISADQIRAITGTKDLDEELSDVGPIYREHEAEGKRFGGGRRFDPTKRDEWGTVDSGRYATIDRGRAAGDRYQLPGEVAARPQPKVAHCVGACTATGGLSREAVRSAIARYDEAILGCYERAGGTARGDVVVELSIGEDGTVIRSDGAGLGTTGGCVAGVIRRVAFPRSAPTTVRYPLSFSPT